MHPIKPSAEIAATFSITANEYFEESTMAVNVFNGKYSLEKSEKFYLENAAVALDGSQETPGECFWRVSSYIASAEIDDGFSIKEAEHLAGKMFWMMWNKDIVLGGRITVAAGNKTKVSLINCISGDTLVHTEDGVVPAATLENKQVKILTEGGVYRDSKWFSFGTQELFKIILDNNDVLYATADHEWIVTHVDYRVKTRDLLTSFNSRATLNIPIQAVNAEAIVYNEEEYRNGVRHGLVFGDGSLAGWKKEYSSLPQFGDSVHLLDDFFSDITDVKPYSPNLYDGATIVRHLPREWKTNLPSKTDSISYLRGFIAGMIGADGTVGSNRHIELYQAKLDILEKIRELCIYASIPTKKIRLVRKLNPWNNTPAPLYAISFYNHAFFDPKLIIKNHHKDVFLANSTKEFGPTQRGIIGIKNVESTGIFEKVYCCFEPETHTMVIGRGYLTGQCTTTEPPSDSLESIYDIAKKMARVLSLGEGVGIDVTNLRPENMPTNNAAKSTSGAISWLDLYDFTTGTVSQVGRRGACLGSIKISHPETLKFIKVKSDLKKINNANISLQITDDFMQAVKDDGDWQFYWVNEHGKRFDFETVKARDIMHEIAAHAAVYAEPGIQYFDTAQYFSNSDTLGEPYKIVSTNASLVAGTLVHTDIGIFPIEQLENKTFKVKSLNGEWANATCFLSGTDKPTVKIDLGDGRINYATFEHEWPVYKNGILNKITSDKLQKGDLLYLNRNEDLGIHGQYDNLTREDGFYVGDNFDVFTDLSLPQEIWESNDEFIKGFVDGLFSNHSFVTSYTENLSLFDFELIIKNKNIALEVQKLLSFYGISSVVKSNGLNFDKINTSRFANIFTLVNEKAQNKLNFFKKLDNDLNYIAIQNIEINNVGQPVWDITVDHNEHVFPVQHVYTGNCCIPASESVLTDQGWRTVKELINTPFNAVVNGKSYPSLKGFFFSENAPVFKVIYNDGYRDATFRATDNHKFMIWDDAKNEFALKELKDFVSGDKIQIDNLGGSPDRASILAIEPDGVEDTYDVTVEEIHLFNLNGVIASNSEQFLDPWGQCTLGHANWATLPLTSLEAAEKEAEERGYYIAWFLDNVVTKQIVDKRSPLPESEAKIKALRRIGQGFTGLADYFSKIGISYDSKEAIHIAGRLTRAMTKGAYKRSIEAGEKRGSFKAFDVNKIKTSPFIQHLISDGVIPADFKHLRNVCSTTVAPVGTGNIIVRGWGNGVEPGIGFIYWRRTRISGEYVWYFHVNEFVYELLNDADLSERIRQAAKTINEMPIGAERFAAEDAVFKLIDGKIDLSLHKFSHEVDPFAKADLMGEVQKYIDSAISVTYNMPESATVEDIEKLFIRCWENNLKGVAIYREDPKNREPIFMFKRPTSYNYSVETKSATKLLDTDYIVAKRPLKLNGFTETIKAENHKFYFTYNKDEDGFLYEVFCHSNSKEPKVSTEAAQTALLGLLREYAVPEAIIEDQINKSSHQSSATRITRLISLALRHYVPVVHIVHVLEELDVTVSSYIYHLRRGLAQFLPTEKTVCPNCNEDAFVIESGCSHCDNCGYSKC